MQKKFWRHYGKKFLENKIYEQAPVELLDLIRLQYKYWNKKQVPKRATRFSYLSRIISKALRNLPLSLVGPINHKVRAIFILKDLETTSHIITPHGAEKSIIIFNETALLKYSNEWCTWRTQSLFPKKSPYKVKCILTNNSNVSNEVAIQYAFFQTLAHLL